MNNYRALFCIVLAFAGVLTASAGQNPSSSKPSFDGVPGPAACGPFAIGLVAAWRRRSK